MTNGETIRYQCEGCDREMEITLEPKEKLRDKALENREMGLDAPTRCPWCEQLLEEV